jgi:hypothetical protein
MGRFKEFMERLFNEAGMTPVDKATLDRLNKSIALIDKQISAKIGAVGKGKLVQQSGEDTGHLNEKDPEFIRLTNQRKVLLAKKSQLTAKVETKL